MADKPRFLDVWIIESNTVYREVPFTVVVDWVQQGRLLENDQLRWSGQAEWFTVGGARAFAAYLPQADPLAAEDEAEAREPLHGEMAAPRRRHDDDDDDVDMIPLIDVSLVLLIFFMMTAGAAVATSGIDTPPADSGYVTSDPAVVWVGIKKADNGNPVYSMGEFDKAAEVSDLNSLEDLLDRLNDKLSSRPAAKLNIQADKELPSGFVTDLIKEIDRRRTGADPDYEKRKYLERVRQTKYIGVSEASP
jgi:biopolymer transport protein ExbD